MRTRVGFRVTVRVGVGVSVRVGVRVRVRVMMKSPKICTQQVGTLRQLRGTYLAVVV